MPFLRNSFVLFLVLLGAGSATALEWQITTVDARAEPFQKTLILTFAFKNVGVKSVNILDLQTDCSCLAASVGKKVYAPGEAGRITTQFSLDERSGLYERHLNVVTDESISLQRLNVRIEVPELATLTPRSLEWRIGEASVEKVIELHAPEAQHITFAQAMPTNDSFAVRLEPVVPDQVYKLIVLPRNTTTVANAAIRISGHDPAGREVLISAYANVR